MTQRLSDMIEKDVLQLQEDYHLFRSLFEERAALGIEYIGDVRWMTGRSFCLDITMANQPCVDLFGVVSGAFIKLPIRGYIKAYRCLNLALRCE